MKYKNPKFTKDGLLDVVLSHPELGEIPFTVDPKDKGALIDVKALDAEIRAAGNIAAYVEPAPQPEIRSDIEQAIEILADELPKGKKDAVLAKLNEKKKGKKNGA